MKVAPGFDFDEENAKELVALLQESANLMNEAARYANTHCNESATLPFNTRLAEILADLGWDILEQGFYKKHPYLRPEESTLHPSKQ